MSGDHTHAVKHLAFGLDNDPADPEGIAIVETLVTMLGPDAASLVDMQEPIWAGDVAVQALILHALGRDTEAVGLLLQLVVADPSKRRSAWLRAWVDDPHLSLAPYALAETMFRILQTDRSVAPDDPRILTLADLTDIASIVVKRSEAPTLLFTMASMTARRARMNDEALAFGREAWSREPTAEHLCLVGYAYRDLGDLQQALEVFVQASSLAPGSVAVRLDTAETLAGMERFDEAAEWTNSVLGVDPTHETAAAQAAYYRQRANDA